MWNFIGAIDARHVGQLPITGLFVQAFRVTLLAHFQRRIDKHFNEILIAYQFSCHLALSTERADEGGHHDQAGIHHQFGHFGHPANVFYAVSVRKTQVLVQSLTDVVAIEDVGALAQGVELLL